mgnify:CR=1 FL=1
MLCENILEWKRILNLVMNIDDGYAMLLIEKSKCSATRSFLSGLKASSSYTCPGWVDADPTANNV